MIQKNYIRFFFVVAMFTISLFGQEKDITKYLQAIENGKIAEVKQKLPALLMSNPTDPSLMFLDAVVTSSGERAADKYTSLLQRYPQCKYADACLFRLYNYYSARGLYQKAQQQLATLKEKFPKSSYIKQTDIRIVESKKVEPAVKKIEDKPKEQPVKLIKSKFTLQIGAFLAEKNANSLKEKVAADGTLSQIKEKNIGGSVFYIVFAGGYSTEKAAEQVIAEVNKKFGVKSRVVPVE